jgi:type II secretory pathway component GspD/PulD (secretin)
MSVIMSFTIRALVVAGILSAAALPMDAQRGGRPPRTQAVPPPDTGVVKRTPAGFLLDFQEQDLRTVLSALAEASGLNVSLTNIPNERVTLRMGQPVSREGMVEVLRQLSDAHNLKMTESDPLIRIEGPAPSRTSPQQTLAQQIQAANQAAQPRLYIYRLRHASAVQLAPVLMSVFSGLTTTAATNRTTVVPNPGAGLQIFTPQGPGGGVPVRPPEGAANPQRGQIADVPVAGVGRGGGGRGQAAQAAQAAAQAEREAAVNLRALAQNALQQVQQAFGGGALSNTAGDIRIIAEESSNSLLIRANAEDWALVQQIVQGVDLRPLQVLIEVTIAEVQRRRDLNVGISGTVTHTEEGKTKPNAIATLPSLASARDFVLQLTGGNGTIDYDVALNALQSRGDVRVLSLPVIIAQNNRQAQLNVGSSHPFIQVSQSVPLDPTSRVQTVQYIDVGTVLTITPTINPDGYVNLQVTQTDNSATNEVQFDAPIINKREATTQVFIRDGQTTVIGGLAGRTRDHTETGIPILSRIPFIGPYLFGNVQRTDLTSELFLFLTPHIISTDEDIDKLREAVKEGSDLLKQVPVGARIIPAPDTLTIRRDTTVRRPPGDSLRTLRVRPPRDTTIPDTLSDDGVEGRDDPVILSEAKDLISVRERDPSASPQDDKGRAPPEDDNARAAPRDDDGRGRWLRMTRVAYPALRRIANNE